MTWQAELEEFGSRDGTAAWNLPRDRVAADLVAMLTDPDQVNQGMFGFCGIAACLRSWARRDPDAVASRAIELYESGTTTIGSITLRPRAALRRRAYLAGEYETDSRCPPGQWMVMGAIQDHISLGGFDGTVDHSWTRVIDYHEGTNPSDLVSLLRNTGLYTVANHIDWASTVLPRASWLPDPWRPTLDDAVSLGPSDRCDVIILVNDDFLPGSAVPKSFLGRLEEGFPNHYVALATHLAPAPDGHVRGRIWTWGEYIDLDVHTDVFLRSFYGGIVATAR